MQTHKRSRGHSLYWGDDNGPKSPTDSINSDRKTTPIFRLPICERKTSMVSIRGTSVKVEDRRKALQRYTAITAESSDEDESQAEILDSQTKNKHIETLVTKWIRRIFCFYYSPAVKFGTHMVCVFICSASTQTNPLHIQTFRLSTCFTFCSTLMLFCSRTSRIQLVPRCSCTFGKRLLSAKSSAG